MAKTRGRTPKPIPQFVLDGLTRLGYRRMQYDRAGVPVWRHPAHPDLRTSVIVPNTPGEERVVVDWTGQPPTMLSPESYLRQLEDQLEMRRVRMRPEHGSSD